MRAISIKGLDCNTLEIKREDIVMCRYIDLWSDQIFVRFRNPHNGDVSFLTARCTMTGWMYGNDHDSNESKKRVIDENRIRIRFDERNRTVYEFLCDEDIEVEYYCAKERKWVNIYEAENKE